MSDYFKDRFEPAGASARPRTTVTPMSAAEQTFWRIVRADADLARVAGELKIKGRFQPGVGASADRIYYHFVWNGQPKHFDAHMTPASNAAQVRNFLTACANGLRGVFEKPDIRPYKPRTGRPSLW